MTTAVGQTPSIGWFGIVRLGAVQMALGAIVVLVTSTLNRVMVVELALPAALPGMLVGWHYAVQITRPRWGYGADKDGRRSFWIVGGMAVLAVGGVGAAASAAVLSVSPWAGLLLSFVAFTMIGIGVGASGTNLLALIAASTPSSRKPAAAAIAWIMMIAGFVLTTALSAPFLEPFTFERLVLVTATVGAIAVCLTSVSLVGMAGSAPRQTDVSPGSGDRVETALGAHEIAKAPRAFGSAVADVLRDPRSRRFTVFVFVSMLAYSAQDLILEPFAGLVHGYSPADSTRLASIQNGGVLVGMIATAIIGSFLKEGRSRFMARWTVFGCVGSAAALLALAAGAVSPGSVGLKPSVFGLGAANGCFAVAAIGSMMLLASEGRERAEGTRMGVWGAAQAVAFGLGGLAGAVAADLARRIIGDTGSSFAVVFSAEALVFLISAALAARVISLSSQHHPRLPVLPAGQPMAQAE